ncbi:polysaccharide biosynthesis tyrosine autokinase [Corynebacterium sp. TAE3-ERU2]|uniref:polysaccharide biosynthesis tyrosine autokinase n=1 Tax=Corynebacterium sp. TAE3-ERU2 TaxID=2849497 RepID=UPI001C4692A2|nr:polysaccharide biosynthesis tyrosine autokinase [Corynebacterium sp. TAE3-ERU2]MBV7301762.1 polysaccharide biosynthesis tyrosine autokinase [Corynebacterium sp. TAE3-ERU2]
MTFTSFKSFFSHRWWIILLVMLLGIPAGLGVSYLREDRYVSQATVYISVNQATGEAANPYQASLTSQQMVKSYAELVTNAAVTNKVVDRVVPPISRKEVEQALSASANANSVLLEISATTDQAQLSKDIADATIEVFTNMVKKTSTPEGQSLPTISANVVAPPSLPEEPSNPSPVAFALAGAFLGLALGLLIALIVHMTDRRLRTHDDVAEITTLPQLGTIPEDKHISENKQIDFSGGFSRTAESFRTLRTNLQFCAIDSNPRIIQITSALAGSGKSITALNLAASLAEQGEKVCLIEGDLRRPRLTEYMEIDAPVGLTNVLRREMDLEDALIDDASGVTLLASGPIPPNPAEIIGSNAMSELLQQLKDTYDYVIVDSAPVLPVTDAALLARIVDGTVMIARWNTTTRDNLTSSIDALEKVNAQLLGVVLSRTVESGRKSDYNHYYDRVDEAKNTEESSEENSESSTPKTES